jgi:beta-galactosidase/beta-glucuronidase
VTRAIIEPCVIEPRHPCDRYSAAAHEQMVASAADANMNFLRIWGGGVFLPDAFYDAADRLGVLIYHDMMYVRACVGRV